MPVACSKAQPSGQALACETPMDQMLWVLVPVPMPLLLFAPSWLPCAPAATSTPNGLKLWPRDLAELGEGSGPKDVGVHAGPRSLAHPFF